MGAARAAARGSPWEESMRRTTGRLTLAGAWLLLAGAPLLAQQPAPSGKAPGAGERTMPHMQHMQGTPMAACPMHSAAMRGPAAALRSASALGITTEQRTRLQTVQRRVDAMRASSMAGMQAIHTELLALSQRPRLDEGAARAALDRMGRVHTEMGLAMLRASSDVAGILTPAQRDSLAAIGGREMSKPGAMPMSGMPMSGMPMCPMMGASAK
jgi:Spy/CpxP family protein refolding chaperone